VGTQLVASQVTVLVTFMPAVVLSGFLFDLRSMPAPVRLITYALPARYYVTLLQTVFLAGDVWGVLLPNATVLASMAAVLLLLTRGASRKKLTWAAVSSSRFSVFSLSRARNSWPCCRVRATARASWGPRSC